MWLWAAYDRLRPGGSSVEIRVVGPGEGERTYRARGSVMFFKALAERDDGDCEPPSPDEEQARMGRFGMEPA
jgi:hypothetical protein